MSAYIFGRSPADTERMDELTPCANEDCARQFLAVDTMLEHATAVHGEEVAREFNAKQRKAAAKKGQALPGGGFPIQNAQDLKNAIQALGRAKNKAAAKAHIIKRARALGLTKQLPSGWTSGDSASLSIDCPDCGRQFLDESAFIDHAEATHTFSDIERLVSETVREKYYRRADYKAVPPVPGVYAWVNDLAEDWVVFSVETDGDSTLYKASYSITDGEVTLGQPAEVKRRTVYEPVEKEAS